MTLWKKYGLGIAFLAMFLVAWAVMTWTDWGYFVGEQHDHHQVAEWFGSSGYIWRWGLDTFSNWQADFLGQGLAVILGAYLIFRGSSQSKDTSEQIQQTVEDIERRVRGPQAARQAQSRTAVRVAPGGIWRNYTLGYALIGAFLVSWALMTWMGWMNFAANAQEHKESAEVFGASGYIWEWLRQTFENWQADILGHAAMIIVPAYLLYRGSSESRESDDRIEQAVRRIQQALQRRDQQAAPAGSTIQETRPRQQPASPPSFWKKYSLGIAFISFFLLTWALQTWTGWSYFLAQQQEHHQLADVFGSSGYIWLWGTDTFSNWQSDLLWEGLAILLGAYLIFRGSTMSRDTNDRVEELADSIERQVRGEQPAQQAQTRTDRDVSRGGIWRNRGLAYSLIGAGIISWALMTWMGWMDFSANQQEHGSTAAVFGASGYIWDWARLTLENWQSDLLGHAAIVILPAYLLYKASAESRESDDQIEQALQRIKQALDSNQQQLQPAPATESARGGRQPRS